MTWQKQSQFDFHYLNNDLNNNELEKLATAQSLTKSLSSLELGADFSVKLNYLGEINSHYSHYFDNLNLDLNLDLNNLNYIREVELLLNQIPVVHAQSFCNQDSRWCEILNCGSQSLGTILFSGNIPLKRSELYFSQNNLENNQYIIKRYSWFEWENEYLHLIECFLPEIIPFLK